MRPFLVTLAKLAEERKLRALLIGGHAVTALGFPRATYDVDLLIVDRDAPAWQDALATLRLQTSHRSGAFIQLDPPADWPIPPVDLMCVDEATWQQLQESSEPVVGSLSVPSPLGLIALKAHAASQPGRGEDALRDWNDIFGIVAARNIPLHDSALRETLQTYGGAEAIARLDAAQAAAG